MAELVRRGELNIHYIKGSNPFRTIIKSFPWVFAPMVKLVKHGRFRIYMLGVRVPLGVHFKHVSASFV